jgi:protein SCO1/2
VCPTELQSISLALDKLGAAADAVQPLFITVDPARDTPARLAEFVSSFHPRLIGLTGSPAEIRKTGNRLPDVSLPGMAPPRRSIIRSTIPASFISIGKDGRYLGFLPPGLATEAIAEAIRARLGAGELTGKCEAVSESCSNK